MTEAPPNVVTFQ